MRNLTYAKNGRETTELRLETRLKLTRRSGQCGKEKADLPLAAELLDPSTIRGWSWSHWDARCTSVTKPFKTFKLGVELEKNLSQVHIRQAHQRREKKPVCSLHSASIKGKGRRCNKKEGVECAFPPGCSCRPGAVGTQKQQQFNSFPA